MKLKITKKIKVYLKVALTFLFFLFFLSASLLPISANFITTKTKRSVSLSKKEDASKFLIKENFEVWGDNNNGKIDVNNEVSKLKDINFLYSKDKINYSSTTPANLSNGDNVYIKIDIKNKNKYYLPAGFSNKITVEIVGLPDAKNNVRLTELGYQKDTKYGKIPRVRLLFKNLLDRDWKLHHKIESSSSHTHPFYTHPNDNVIRLVKLPTWQTAKDKTWVDFYVKKLDLKSGIWFKFKNRRNGTIYKYKFIRLNQINSIPIIEIKHLKNDSRPATTRYSNDAQPHFQITNPDLLKRVKVVLRNIEDKKEIEINLERKENNIYTIVFKNNEINLYANKEYEIIFITKDKNVFFSQTQKNQKSLGGGREYRFPFKTRISRGYLIRKPNVIEKSVIAPKTASSEDGIYSLTFNNFDPIKMRIDLEPKTTKLILKKRKVFDERGNILSNIIKIVVKNLKSGQKFQLKFSLRPKYIKFSKTKGFSVGWEKTLTPHKFQKSWQMTHQSYRGITKPYVNYKSFKTPTTKNSVDGSLKFNFKYYNPEKISFKVISEFNGKKRELPNPKLIKNNLYKIDNLRSNEKLSFIFNLKKPKNNLWSDGKKDAHKQEIGQVPESPISGFKKPTFKFVNEKPATTTTSTNGAIEINIENFDETGMIIETSVGKISKIKNNLWRVEKLQQSQELKITIKLKDKYFWNSQRDIKQDITFQINTKKTTYEGINKIALMEDPTNSKIPKTFTSSDGELGLEIRAGSKRLGESEIREFFKNVDYQIVSNIKNPKIDLQIKPLKAKNLKDNEEIEISFQPKSGKYWKDGTSSLIKFRLKAPKLNAFAIKQPVVKRVFIYKLPTDNNNNNGEIQIEFDDFNHKKMFLKPNIGIIGNLVKNKININKIGSGQKISVIITPKPGYAWQSGDDLSIDPFFVMDKILDFPKSENVKMETKHPNKIGGEGYVDIKKIVFPKYKNEKNPAAYLEYQKNNQKWKQISKTNIKLEGINNDTFRFRWKLNNGYSWSEKSLIIEPKNVVLKNPGAASVPKIKVWIKQISKPGGSGKIIVYPFSSSKPNGARLQYKTNKDSNWQDMNYNGKSWEGKNGFKVEFRWKLNKRFVWDLNQPQKIINAVAMLVEPIDNKPPEWKFKNNAVTGTKIIKKTSKLYEVDLKYYYNQKILLNEVKDLFEAEDRYGKYQPQMVNSTFSKDLVVTKNNSNAIILRAEDLAGNVSKLKINILIKYKIVDLSKVDINKIEFQHSFSGFGEIKTDNTKIPAISFKEIVSNNLISLKNYNIFAVYRLTDKNGNPISWKNNEGQKVNGWSVPDKNALNSFGRYYPKNFDNDQIIEIKFVPKKGYKINDYGTSRDALFKNGNPKLSMSSRIFKFKISGLVKELKASKEEPKYSFLGSDGKGRVDITPPQKSNVYFNKSKYLAQIFRPYVPKHLDKNSDIVDKNGDPIYGFEIYIPTKESDMNNDKNWHLVSGIDNLSLTKNLDTNAIRKLWKDTLLSTKINNVKEIINTFIDTATINKLFNFYSLRLIEKSNKGWGFKYLNPKKINVYPQNFIKNIVWKEKDGSLYLGKKVKNLSIDPLIDIRDKSFFMEIKPSLGNSYKYEGDVRIVFSYYPSKKSGDKFVWRYKILNKRNEIISPYSDNINIKNIKNGYKLVVGYKAIPPFTLNTKFSKIERIFLINGLKIKIDISSVPRPKITFSGKINYGKIVNLVENSFDLKTSYDRSSGFPIPKTKSGKIKLKWQYRVFKTDPNKIIKSKHDNLDNYKWEDKIPRNLNNNDYIQIRVAPVNTNKYGVEPKIYSIDDKTKSPFVKVNNLEIDTKLFQNISFEIIGDNDQNAIRILDDNKQKDYIPNFQALIFEVKMSDEQGWKPLTFFNNKLKNGIVLSFRAYAKNSYLASLPNPDTKNGVKIKNSKKYLQFFNWKKIAIKGLKTTIRFGYININNPKLIAMKNTPWKKIGKSSSDSIIVSGWAEIAGSVVNLQHLKTAYYEDNGVNVPAGDQVEVQYQLLEYYKPTNKLISRGWSTIPPTGLKNKDQIQIQIVPKNPQEFQLDWKREIIFKVKDLYEYNQKTTIKAPKMIFSGINGKGIATPEINVPPGYEYFYLVYNQKKQIIKDWSQDLPKNLKNDYYIKSRITKKDFKKNDLKNKFVDSKLQKVYGLFNIHSIENIDTKMFLDIKIIGRINHKAHLHIKIAIINKLQQNNYQIEYIIYNKENKQGKRYLTTPHNLSNGDVVEIEILNKRTGKVYNLRKIEKKFKGIIVKGLVDDEEHTKTMSKSIWIPVVIMTSLLIFTIPLYIFRRKKKFSI